MFSIRRTSTLNNKQKVAFDLNKLKTEDNSNNDLTFRNKSNSTTSFLSKSKKDKLKSLDNITFNNQNSDSKSILKEITDKERNENNKIDFNKKIKIDNTNEIKFTSNFAQNNNENLNKKIDLKRESLNNKRSSKLNNKRLSSTDKFELEEKRKLQLGLSLKEKFSILKSKLNNNKIANEDLNKKMYSLNENEDIINSESEDENESDCENDEFSEVNDNEDNNDVNICNENILSNTKWKSELIKKELEKIEEENDNDYEYETHRNKKSNSKEVIKLGTIESARIKDDVIIDMKEINLYENDNYKGETGLTPIKNEEELIMKKRENSLKLKNSDIKISSKVENKVKDFPSKYQMNVNEFNDPKSENQSKNSISINNNGLDTYMKQYFSKLSSLCQNFMSAIKWIDLSYHWIEQKFSIPDAFNDSGSFKSNTLNVKNTLNVHHRNNKIRENSLSKMKSSVKIKNTLKTTDANFKLLIKAIMGITIACQNTPNIDLLKEINIKDSILKSYSKDRIYTIEDSGSNTNETYYISEFAPVIFHNIRAIFNISKKDYIDSISPQGFITELMISSNTIIEELFSTSKSGSMFFYTKNGKFIIKTLPKREYDILKNILPDYFKHLKNNKETMLPRYFGLYQLIRYKDGNAEKLYFITTNNLFCTRKEIKFRFDLKGSTYKRNVFNEKIDLKSSEKITYALKDLDFTRTEMKFQFSKTKKEKILNTIEKDSEFLAQHGLIDYSLLIGIHYTDSHLNINNDKLKIKDNMDNLDEIDKFDNLQNMDKTNDGLISQESNRLEILDYSDHNLYLKINSQNTVKGNKDGGMYNTEKTEINHPFIDVSLIK